MRFVKQLALGSITALLLAACGGGSEQAAKVTYSSVVSFGDSLSDAGTYKVGQIAAVGGMFTVNGITGAIGASTAPSYVWPQLVAAAIVGTPSCAARMGFAGAVAPVPGCTNYAQGGSRVTDINGSGHAGGAGALTEPVVAQIQNFLALPANGGKFKGTELVTVQGGANDLFVQGDVFKTSFMNAVVTRLVLGAPSANQAAVQTAVLTAVATQVAAEASSAVVIGAAITAAATHAVANSYNNLVAFGAAADQGAALLALASNDATPAAIASVTLAAKELADAVKSIVSSGAKRVVVMNIPDASQAPGTSSEARPLTAAMLNAFNSKLKSELTGVNSVLLLDVFAENQKQFATPEQFGLTNVKDKVCKVDSATNPTGSSLFCNPTNVLAGDTSRYLFADGVHPTPYGHKLLAQFVTKELVLAGWL
jgi:phospholipase/lecithinase/hemolysin